MDPPPPLVWPGGLAPVWCSTSVAAFSVCALRLAGSGRKPAGSWPTEVPGVWPGLATKVEPLGDLRRLVFDSPPVGTIA